MKTDKGDITCEHIVSCTGNFARKTGRMVGLDVPVIPVEHQFIVTEPHPEVVARRKQGLPEMGVLRDSDNAWYMREENGGLLLGPYEVGAPCCYADDPHPDTEWELFQGDLERLEPHIEGAILRVPAFGEVGVKQVYNGAIAYTPDGSPIVGPAWGLRNFWLNEGHSFGITAAGGAGWQLPNGWSRANRPSTCWASIRAASAITPPRAICGARTRKPTPTSSPSTSRTRNAPPAGRCEPAPCYDRMRDLGAVFGQKFGWERPNFFVPPGTPAEDDWSFRRSHWFSMSRPRP